MSKYRIQQYKHYYLLQKRFLFIFWLTYVYHTEYGSNWFVDFWEDDPHIFNTVEEAEATLLDVLKPKQPVSKTIKEFN